MANIRAESQVSDKLSAQAGMKESLCPHALTLDIVVYAMIQSR